jgi:ribosome-associated heat shock protein Hsp15
MLKVLALGIRRGPPADALALYEDLTSRAAPAAAERPAAGRDAGNGRPTKRQRRQIERLKTGSA